VSTAERIYRRLLHLYPRDFREEYGEEMSMLFRERERARDGAFRLWLQIAGDLIGHAPREHWHTLTQDLRYALRQVRRNPGFSAVVIATLALGIGGTTAVFSVLQAVLIAPLPYEQPGQLVRFYQQEPDKAGTKHYLTGAHFAMLREHAASFEGIAALANYSEAGRDLVKDGRAQRLRVLQVTSDYFSTLRSGAMLGPGFDRGDEAGSRRVVLSRDLWRSRFNADSTVIGATVHLSGEPHEVVGVAPPGFEDPMVGIVDAWLPYRLARDRDPENNSLSAIGRLRSGVSLDHARAELASVSGAMKDRWPAPRLSAVVAVPLQADLVAPARGPLHLLFVAVGLVLLVACVNVANLVLARASGRVHEFAVRSALGSGSRRLVRQMLVESLVLASLGGLLGLVLATVMVRALLALGGEAIPRLDEVGFDPIVLGFAALVTLATAVVSGVAPALRFGQVPPINAVRQRASATRAQGQLRSALVAVQLALALTLLAGAGVLLASIHRVQQVNLGVRVHDVLTFDVNLPSARYDADRRASFQEDLARTLRGLPSVVAAGGISFLPATGSYHRWNTSILSGPRAGSMVATRDGFNMQHRVVSGDLFAALSIPLLAGRTFDDRDDRQASPRVVVSSNFARIAFPGLPLDGVVGQRIRAGGRPPLEIIGIVGDVALDVYGAPSLVVYHAHRQFADDRNWALTQVVAAQLPPERLVGSVRDAVATLDPELVVHRAAAMTDVVGRGTGRERFALTLMASFAAVSLLLATLGLYGVVAYAVRQRTQEIGIRIALGATALRIKWMVLREASVVLVAGVAIGIAGALMLGRWLATLTFEINPSDPRILLAAAGLLVMTGLFAAWWPARRASRVTPKLAMLGQ
jgi:putative ABC transport system permease protein